LLVSRLVRERRCRDNLRFGPLSHSSIRVVRVTNIALTLCDGSDPDVGSSVSLTPDSEISERHLGGFATLTLRLVVGSLVTILRSRCTQAPTMPYGDDIALRAFLCLDQLWSVLHLAWVFRHALSTTCLFVETGIGTVDRGAVGWLDIADIE